MHANAVALVDGENGHAPDAELLRARLVAAHITGIGVAQQHVANGRSIQPDVARQTHERVVVAHRLTLGEIGRKQPFDHRRALSDRVGEMDQPMGVERITGDRAIETKLETVKRARGCHAIHHRLRLLGRHSVLGGQQLHGGYRLTGGGGGVKLEAAPDDVERVAMGERMQRLLESALADVAPGAGNVGPDFDVHGEWHRSVVNVCGKAALSTQRRVSATYVHARGRYTPLASPPAHPRHEARVGHGFR